MNIGIDFDGLFAELKRIMRELQEFPSPAEVAVAEGDVSDTTRQFHSAVRQAAREMGFATEKAVEKLQNTHDTIRAAVLQIAEQDAALADESKLILSLLDSAVEQAESNSVSVTGSSRPETTTPAAGDAQGSADRASDEPQGVDY